MKKNAVAAFLLCAGALGSATACSGQSSTSATGAATTSAAAGTASTAPATKATRTSSNATAAAAATPSWSAVPQSWLSPSRVPLDASLHWTGGAASTAQNGADLLDQSPILYPCTDADHQYNTFATGVVGFARNTFRATADVSTADFNGTPEAVQMYVVYDNAAATQAAYQAIVRDVQKCTLTKDMADVNHVPSTQRVTTTATAADKFAYTDIRRTDQGKPAQTEGNYSSDSDYHTYIVRSGNLIEIVYLAGGPAVDPSGNDGAALATLAHALS